MTVKTQTSTPTNETVTRYLLGVADLNTTPSYIKPYIEKTAPYIGNFVKFCEDLIPIIHQIYSLSMVYWEKLKPYKPELLLPSLIGFILCFFGGSYLTLIAAVEAYRMVGYESTLKCISELAEDLEKVFNESKKDDAVDADGDGTADVLQIDSKQLVQRKMKLFLINVDPQRFTNALNGINAGFLAVLATLKLEFAKAITLGNSIGTILEKPIQAYFPPILEKVIAPEYHKWIRPVLSYLVKSFAISIAWTLQRVISAFHSAIRGGMMFGRNILHYLSAMKIVSIDDKDSYIDEVIGYVMAALGLIFQLRTMLESDKIEKDPHQHLLQWVSSLIYFYQQFYSWSSKVLHLVPTPWIYSGDVRTLLPFLTFNPARVEYIRRWVCVPLSADTNMDRIIAEKSDAHAGCEAVAVDWFPSADSLSHTITQESGPRVAVLILAGLTGGSQEGYVVDLVNTIHQTHSNYDCFVMIGRGLAGSPCQTGVTFHGARISDVVTCAKIIRTAYNNAFGKDHPVKLFGVGISMGAIILSNAMVKSTLHRYVDGVTSISGCFNSNGNALFERSRRLWQPALVHGLKVNFVQPAECVRELVKRFGHRLQRVVDSAQDVVDFDSIFVTNLHGFESVADYYEAMNPTVEDFFLPSKNFGVEIVEDTSTGKKRIQLKKPMFCMHAIDDPIIHVDTIPCYEMDLPAIDENNGPFRGILPNHVDNMIVLITSTGGHVGWPVGFFPWNHRWSFMNRCIIEFMAAVKD